MNEYCERMWQNLLGKNVQIEQKTFPNFKKMTEYNETQGGRYFFLVNFSVNKFIVIRSKIIKFRNVR